MNLCEKESINNEDSRYNQILELCHLSKNLYNASLYDVRQYFFNTKKYKTWQTQRKEFVKNTNPDYATMNSHVAGEVLMQIGRQFLAFFNTHKTKNKRIPRYKDKQGYNVITFPKLTISKKIVQIGDKQLFEYTLCPRSYKIKVLSTRSDIKMFKMSVQGNGTINIIKIYSFKEEKGNRDNQRYASIDLGINNMVTLANNIGIRPLLINGRPIKSINQFYNKRLAKMQSQLSKTQHTSHKIQQFSQKRSNKIDYELHKISKYIVQYLLNNNITKLVIGNNVGWKDSVHTSKRNNQNFVNIPHSRLISQLVYKCQMVGIKVVLTEESYTSKSSFLDVDILPAINDTTNDNKKLVYKFQGKRIKRGLYRSLEKNIINADVNGAMNIMRKKVSKKRTYMNMNNFIYNPIKITL